MHTKIADSALRPMIFLPPGAPASAASAVDPDAADHLDDDDDEDVGDDDNKVTVDIAEVLAELPQCDSDDDSDSSDGAGSASDADAALSSNDSTQELSVSSVTIDDGPVCARARVFLFDGYVACRGDDAR